MHFLNPQATSRPEFFFTFWFISDVQETSLVTFLKFCSGSHSLAKLLVFIMCSMIINYTCHYCYYYLPILYIRRPSHPTEDKGEQFRRPLYKFSPLIYYCIDAEICAFTFWNGFFVPRCRIPEIQLWQFHLFILKRWALWKCQTFGGAARLNCMSGGWFRFCETCNSL